MIVRWLSLLALQTLGLLAAASAALAELPCPAGCRCDDDAAEDGPTLVCTDVDFERLPADWPSRFHALELHNASLLTELPRNGFGAYEALRRIHIERCPRLERIGRHAFRGLRWLRHVSIVGCPALRTVERAAFAGVGNNPLLRIQITGSPIEEVQSHAFQGLQSVRELLLEGKDATLQSHSLSALYHVDFLTLRGIGQLAPNVFSNSSRFHSIRIEQSRLDVPAFAFAGLSHVNQLSLHSSTIDTIESGAFDGIETLETLELFDNRIGSIRPHAFAGLINVGRVRLARNRIARVASPDALQLPASASVVRLDVADNEFECADCHLRWMEAHSHHDTLLDDNVCGTAGGYRSLRAFIEHVCKGKGGATTLANSHDSLISGGVRDRVPTTPPVLLLLASFALMTLLRSGAVDDGWL